MIAALWQIPQPAVARVVAIENCQSASGADNPERLCKRIWAEQYQPVRYMAFASSNNLIFFSTS